MKLLCRAYKFTKPFPNFSEFSQSILNEKKNFSSKLRNDFEILSKSPYNVVLQESYPATDDGSLSWAAVKWGVRYVNIETRLGWLSMQKRMLKYANENLP